jgi:valyl-tRNA synthetase
MPFLTEEVWQHIAERNVQNALCIANWPKKGEIDEKLIVEFDFAAEVISGIRNIRKEKNIANKDELQLLELDGGHVTSNMHAIIKKLGNISEIATTNENVEGALSFRVKSSEYFIPIAGAIDVDAEKEKINQELDYTRGFLQSVQKKLSNERFVTNAPEKVVEIERKKASDAEAKIETLEKSLASLG